MVTHSKTIVPVTEFDINEFLSKRSGSNVVQPKKEKDRNDAKDFKQVVAQVNEFFKQKFENQNTPEHDTAERQKIEHKAMMGDKESMHMLMDEIATFIRENNIHSVKYPSMYESLAHGVFEQIFRFKEFYKWSLYPDSASAFIRGKEMWFKINGVFVKQEEELESDDTVNEIIRSFQQGNRNFKINEKNPQGELDLSDGTRVTLTIPPRTQVPTIAFRKFIVNTFSFEEQVKRNTIPPEDKRLYEILSNAQLNMIIAGAVESGKSTFLKTVYSHRPKNKVAILVEEHPELYLGRDFPDRLQHEFSVKDGDIQRVFRTMLRYDHDYVIFQEVRGVEADYAIDGASRGATGLLMTYHVTEPENIVEQLAQHIIDEFPNRRNVNEIRRVAQTLHVGITMANIDINGKNIKKVTNVFEVCYDYKTDSAWIQYIVKYDEKTDDWQYNADVTEDFYKRISKANKYNPEVVAEFESVLKSRAAIAPIPKDQIKKPIYFKEGE